MNILLAAGTTLTSLGHAWSGGVVAAARRQLQLVARFLCNCLARVQQFSLLHYISFYSIFGFIVLFLCCSVGQKVQNVNALNQVGTVCPCMGWILGAC